MTEHPAALTARELVTALVTQGVRDVVLAPGSRSAPLAYALHAAEEAGWLRVHVRVDERVAGFVAVGIARVRPSAVVTTSGTAVANLHPSVLEAHHSRLPLLVITADRPHEMRGVGANQTTTQPGIFGAVIRRSADIPAGSHPRGVAAAVVRAVAAATGARGGVPGPVHVDVAFRDPLTPAEPWRPGDVPEPQPHVLPVGGPPGHHVLGPGPQTVVVAGDGAGGGAAEVAAAGGWPLLAEPTSGARGGDLAVPAYQGLLAEPELGGAIERVVVLGRPTLSRDVTALLARDDVEIVVVDPIGEWVDVAGRAAVVAPAVTVAPEARADPAWVAQWRAAGGAVEAELLTASYDRLTGGGVARAVLAVEQTPAVVLGSSLAVRQADREAAVGEGFTRADVVSNRGLAGIDGTIATATGLALATEQPVRALIGDLTFLHDVAALAHGVHEPDVDLQVVVLNDRGGGIFATLEHGRGEHEAVYPRFFGTPQEVDLASMARGLGAAYTRVRTHTELLVALAAGVSGRSVLEVDLTPGE